MELPGAEARSWLSVEVRQRPPPRLQRPVGAVGCRAGGDREGERGTVVGAALVPEGRPPPSRVVLSERNLRPARRRLSCVERAPCEDVHGAAVSAVADERTSAGVDAQPDVLRVAVDDLRGGGSGGVQKSKPGCERQQKAATHPLG